MRNYDDVIMGYTELKEFLNGTKKLDLIMGKCYITVDHVDYERGYEEVKGNDVVSRGSYLYLYYKGNKIGYVSVNPYKEVICINPCDGDYFFIREKWVK